MWLGLGTLLAAVTLTGAAFRYGLFFDEAVYRWEWLICLSALLLAGVRIVQIESLGRKGRMWKSRMQEGAPYSFLLVSGLLLMALLYVAALLGHPASVLGSLQQALRYCAFAGFALLLQEGFGSPAKRVWLSAALQISGIAVAGCALAGWMGVFSFPHMVMTSGDARLTAVGARLAGFVQYPNFLGAVAAAYLLWSWLLLLRARSLIGFALASAGAVPYILVMLLTESRGAWVAAVLAWLAGFLLLTGKERCAWLLYGGWTLVCASAACRAVIGAGLRGPAGVAGGGATVAETLSMLAIFCAAPAGLLGLRLWIGRCRPRVLPGFALGAWIAAVLGTTQLLPPAVYGRLGVGGDSYATAAARGLYYRDAWKLIREAPLLGRGGDAWRSLFKGVQSQPYVGNEVHSGLLELVLDLGLIGLLAGMLIAAAVLIPVWKRDRTGLLPIVALLLHAVIDFDLSFGYDGLLLVSWLVYSASGEPAGEMDRGMRVRAGEGGGKWRHVRMIMRTGARGLYRGLAADGRRQAVLLDAEIAISRRGVRRAAGGRRRRAALMAAGAVKSSRSARRVAGGRRRQATLMAAGAVKSSRSARRVAGGRRRRVALMTAGAVKSSRSARRIAGGRRRRAALMAAAAVCFAAAAMLGWRFDAAVRHREAAAAASGAARTAALRAALEANPYWTRIRLELAALAPPPERAALLAAGLRDEPQSVPLMWALGRESAERGDVRGAADWMRRALDRDRFDRAKQTEAVVTMARLAQTLRAGARGEEARLAADEADAFYAAYKALADRHAPGSRRFAMTAEAEAAAEQCRLLAMRLSLNQAQAQANKPPG